MIEDLKTKIFILVFIFYPFSLWALTLQQAISLAMKTYPPLKEKIHLKEKTQFLYKASFDPYFPTLSSEFSYERTFESSMHTIGRLWDNQYTFGLTISYRLFDGGYRWSQRQQSAFVFDQAIAEIEIIKNDLKFLVKKAFYKCLAMKKIWEVRKEAESIAKKNYELAMARRKVGVAMLSDVTQAQVRYTNARMETLTAKKDLEKVEGDLNSLIGWPLNKSITLEGKLNHKWINVNFSVLKEMAFKYRPEIKKQLLEVKKAEVAIKGYRSAYFPKLDTKLSFYRFDNEPALGEKEAVFLVSLSYDLFDGLGRYYKVSAQRRTLKAEQAKLDEIKREISLEIYQAYKDLELAFANMNIAAELVKEAEVNYNQAYGEYKVGKGDIISLIQAEMNLAESKVKWVEQILNYNIAISALEKAVFAEIPK